MSTRAAVMTALLAIGWGLEAQPSVRPGTARLPRAEVVTGDRTVAAGDHVRTGLVVVGGHLDISGEVDGDVVAVDGDVTVRRGGIVHGHAVALGGRITAPDGRVEGRQVTLGLAGAAAAAASRGMLSRSRQFALLGGIAVLLALLAMVTAATAQRVLDGVANELSRDPAKALLIGTVAQLGLVPGLVLTIVGLVLTVVGVVFVPFAIVAYALAATGLVTLGLLAVARLLGSVLWPSSASRHSASRASLGSVLSGVAILLVPWTLAVALGAVWPSGEWLLRLGAAGATWVAVTAGLGAALTSRVGTRPTAEPAVAPDAYAWATPTPVTGVAAARRTAAL